MQEKKRAAIVTGAGAGVGRAVALTLAKEGCDLVVVGRSEQNTRETAAMAEAYGRAIPVVADIGCEEDTIRYVNTAVEQFGGIDVFVNSAARFQPYVLLADTQTELFDDIMRINVKGAFLGMKYVLRQMAAQKSGVIVNVASRDGLFSEPALGSYSTSKHAMIGLTKNAATEYGPMGIRVCAVCPGAINTKMIGDILKTIDPAILGPMARPPSPRRSQTWCAISPRTGRATSTVRSSVPTAERACKLRTGGRRRFRRKHRPDACRKRHAGAVFALVVPQATPG